MLSNRNDYVFIDDMRDDLRRYLNGEETLGHYVPNLIFTPQLDQAADADQQAAPDPLYYQAQGQEPPQEASYPLLGLAILFILLGGSVAFVWAMGAYVAPTVVGWLFRAAGA